MAIDISVIIPTFRRPAELVEAVGSVLSQRRVRVEIIVIDDSPEGSAIEAITSIGDSRIQYLKSHFPTGGRPALVRNQGWKLAQGRFVHFLDDDDLAAEGAYTVMVDALDANSGKGVVFGRIKPFGNDPDDLRHETALCKSAARRARISNRLGGRWLVMANMLFMHPVLANSGCIVRRECIEPLGGYDPECELNEDADFWMRAIRRFGCVYLDRTVVHRRTGAPSLMHDRESNEPLIRAYRHMYSKYKAEHGSIEFISLKLLARTALRWL